LDQSGMDKASSAVTGALPRAVKMVRISDGKVDVAALLGLNVVSEADIENPKTHHDDELDHDHDEFESFVVPLTEIDDPNRLSQSVSAPAAAAGVLRIKGCGE